jgi:heme exporter protein A
VSALSAEGLTARYPGQSAGAAALQEIDLQLEPGDRLVLLGPNGAGKSTFIRVFAGLMHATHGQALIMGQSVRSARGMIGVVSHASYLYDELTAAENLRFYAKLYGVHEPLQRAHTLLRQVGLAHLADERVGRLSRGQQQRVTIARALLHDPPVLLLDEPDTGLDLAAYGLVEELASEGERTLVMTTHNVASGVRLATRVGVLSRGRLVHHQAGVSSGDASALASMLERLARA